MMRWLLGAGMFVGGTLLGYWLVFLLRFGAVVLPHGGMW